DWPLTSAEMTAPDPRTPTAVGESCLSLPRSVGRYRVEGELGRGGMGVVLMAWDDELDRPLAVKLLLRQHAEQSPLEQRFLAEARLTGQLQHPGIPPVHEMGRLSDGRPYFAMKLIKGHTLSQLLAARRDPREELPRFVGIFEQVCQAIAYAH